MSKVETVVFMTPYSLLGNNTTCQKDLGAHRMSFTARLALLADFIPVILSDREDEILTAQSLKYQM